MNACMRCLPGVLFVAAVGCGRPAPADPYPVQADSFVTIVGRSNVVVLKWQAGPAVLVAVDFQGGYSGFGGPTSYKWSHDEILNWTNPPRDGKPPEAGQAKVTGRGVRWRLDTKDGTTGRMTVDGSEYDLANGNVFLISADPHGGVSQTQVDLAAVVLSYESIQQTIQADPRLRAFVEPTKR